MLQNIRDNAQGTIAKIIVGLIVVTFALFGVESIVGSLSGEPEVASVNGEPITEYEFQRQLERKRRQVINQMGENYDPSLIDENLLRTTTLNEAIANEVQRQAAEDKGLTVAEATIDQFILSWPPAQVDGKFNREQFQAVLRNIGLSALDFRKELRKELMLGQIRSAIAQTSFVLDKELAELLRIERQKRSFKYLELNASDIAEGIDIDADAIKAYYDGHQEDFELPERVRLDYIEINKADLVNEVKLDEAEVRTRYDQEVADFTAEEQRRPSHILFEINDDVSEEAALAKAKDVKTRLDAGESFEELAKAESDDIGSAQAGGDLGFSNKGTFVPEFEEKLFAMETGEVSDPVLTEFGYHIIKLTEVSLPKPPTFEEAEGRIKASLKLEKAEDLFVEYSTKVADLTYSAPDLAGPASELGVSVKTSSAISRSGGEGIFSNPGVLNQAFSEEVLEGGHNSEVVEINRDTLLVVRKNEFLPKQVQPLNDVESEITQVLALQEAKKKLAESVNGLLESAKKDEYNTFDEQDWVDAQQASRNQPEHSAAVRFAFQMPDPASGVVAEKFETDNGYIIVALKEIINDEAGQLSDTEKKTFRSFLSNQAGAQEYSNFNEKLQKLAEIERI